MNANNTQSCHGKTAGMQKFTIGSGKIDVPFNIYPAAILHPSLGCPLIVDNPKQVSLFIVASQTFRQAFLRGNGQGGKTGDAGGGNIRLVIDQHLKIHPWETASDKKKNLVELDQTLFGGDYAKNINCFYLGKLGEELHDRHGRHFANLRTSTKSQFAALHLDEVFQIELSNWQFQPETLYDTFWAFRNNDPTTTDHNEKYLDLRDRMVRQFVGKTWHQGRGAQTDPKAATNGPMCAFGVDSKKGVTFQPDPSVPLQSRHPIYVPAAGKKHLNIGHLSDVHLSSRQHAYKGKAATVIPGVDTTTSKPIGELANNNADNFFDLLNQFAADPQVDVLVITGDLYDHIHNFDPTSRPTSTTGQLWEAMYLDSVKSVKERAKEYPYGIDALAVYSLLVHYYTHSQQKKPVLLISGNHEAYEYPYGISPRFLGNRANEGIPLDHNLTFYEAILLYGPGYAAVLQNKNFIPQNFDWFSTVFSPLSDFIQTYKEQTFIGLQWGEGEDFLWNPTPVDKMGLNEGGTLPRATKSINAVQKRLVEAALAVTHTQKVFCSHFTLANYAMDIPLDQTGRIGFKDNSFSRYDHGTTKAGREALHGQWLAHNRFQLALSGHSHRVGVYQCDYVPADQPFMQQAGNNAYLQLGASMSTANQPAHIRTRGYHPEDPASKNVAWNKRTRVFVTASAGPIPKQNLKGEMSGQGMEYPSAGKIVFNGNTPEITLVKSRRATAKPRFAVACDYIDIMEGGFWEYFKGVGSDGEFELKIHWKKIHPLFPQEKMADFVESVTLWLVGDASERIQGTIYRGVSGAIRIKFPKSLQLKLRPNKIDLIGGFFLSMKFRSSAVQHLPGFKDYDYESPWNIQIGIYDGKGREVQDRPENHKPFIDSPLGQYINNKRHTPDTDPAKWKILRHEKFGEVPYFDWRAEQWPAEFSYQIKKSKT